MRSVQDRFWSDGWVRKLNPLDRYLFLYLLTNEHTNWCGIYELPIETMAFESGLDREELMHSMLPRLSPKIEYKEGWVIVRNWTKHHMAENGTLSPSQKEGIRKALDKVPQHIRDTLSIPYPYPIGGVYASSSSLSSSSLSETLAVRVVPEDQEEDRPKRDSRSKDKESIYRLFSDKEQPWWRHKQQKIAALSLFDLVGYEKVKHGKEVMAENADDKYCPQASTPFEYEEKLPALARYMKRKSV